MSKKQQSILIAFGIGIPAVIANGWHIITQWFNNPQDRYFTWIAHYYADFFLYVSQIAQGMRGNWIMSSSMYTNEPIPDTWVYWPNVLMGKIGSIFPISPFAVYSAFLFVFVVILLVLAWHIMGNIFSKQPHIQRIGFLFFVTASNFIDIPRLFTKGELVTLFAMWFSPTPALNRLGGVPHQTLQTIALSGVILLYTRLFSSGRTKKTPIYGLLFAIACFLTATLSPIQMLIVSMAIVTTTIIERTSLASSVYIGMGLMAGAAGAYLTNIAFDASELYASAKAWEATQTIRTTPIDLLLAMGPIAILLPFGVRLFFSHRSPIRILYFIYGIASLILFSTPIPHMLGTSPTRWIHPASFILFSCIAAEGLFSVSTLITHVFRKNVSLWGKHISQHISPILVLIYIILTVPSLIAQVDARSSKDAAAILYSDVNHIPLSVISVLKALETLPNTGVVLTDPSLPYDAIVPILSGKRSFTGHPVHTLFPQVKEDLRQKFFSGSMDESTAKQFLKDHSIRYILASAAAARMIPLLPFVKNTYYNNDITIYETIP